MSVSRRVLIALWALVLGAAIAVVPIVGASDSPKHADLIQRTRVHAGDVCHANHQLAVVDILDDGTVEWMCYWPQGYKP